MSEFKVGEKVAVFGDRIGTVMYGPVPSTYGAATMYAVEREGDGVRMFKSGDLEPLPKFVVGDKVTTGATEYTLHAGPFNGGLGGHFWVLERPDGTHGWVHANSLTKVEDPVDEPADGFEYEGVFYERRATYRDNDGDYWEFARPDEATDETAMMRHVDPLSEHDGFRYNDESLLSVFMSYGPLTKN